MRRHTTPARLAADILPNHYKIAAKNEVRPGAWHHRLLLLAQCDVVSVSVGGTLEQAYLSKREA